MKIKAVIFDLDGVLVFTDQYHYQAWKKIADEKGVYFDEKINDRLRGVSRMESLDIILEQDKGMPLTQNEKELLAEKKNRIYRKLLENMTSEDVTDDVRKTLKALRDRGYKIALGSSSKNAKFILEKTEVTDLFDAIADGTVITRSKPDPEVFLKAADFLKIPPENCLVVEDAEAGIQAAKAGNMQAAAIGDAVKLGMADYNLDKIEDLLKIVKDAS